MNPAIRLALHAEWTKLRTIAGGYRLLAATVALTIGLSAAVSAGVSCSSSACNQDAAKTSLTGVYLGQLITAVLAVTVVGNEYSTGMIGTTFTAMPRRWIVLAAKAILVGGAALAAGLLGVLGSVLAGRLILPGNGFTLAHGYHALSLLDATTLRAAGGSVLYIGLIALLAVGMAALVRDSAAGIGALFALLFLFPIAAAAASDEHVRRHLEQISPMQAGLGIQTTVNLHGLVISPWAGLGVLGLWAVGALVLGGLSWQLHDA
jgi:ABC-2 type transport system permease protein